METKIDFKRIDNDVNGNPRYVCHFLNLLTEQEKYARPEDGKGITAHSNFLSYQYSLAVSRAKNIGGRKYHNKSYGGGIVFQSYNLMETEKQILKLVKEAEPKVQNLRGFKVTFVPSTNKSPNRVKIYDMRHNKTIIVSYGAETPDNDTELAKYTLNQMGIPVIAQTWDEKDKYTVLLTDNFKTQIK